MSAVVAEVCAVGGIACDEEGGRDDEEATNRGSDESPNRDDGAVGNCDDAEAANCDDDDEGTAVPCFELRLREGTIGTCGVVAVLFLPRGLVAETTACFFIAAGGFCRFMPRETQIQAALLAMIRPNRGIELGRTKKNNSK